jgi:transposase
MPFLRLEKKKSGTYLRILESYRNDHGQSTHRILHSLGKVADYTPEQLRRIGLRFYELGGGEIKPSFEGEICELGRYNYGFQYVYAKALEYYGLHHILRRIQRSTKIEFNIYDAVLLMLLERLQQPSSKKSNYEHQHEYLHLPQVELHHLYRSLDQLADHNELIQRQIYQSGRDLFNSQLDVVFYDVTTFYFESDVEQEGALRQMGFGKDGKIGNTQILFCLMIDKDKNPIGYRVFKGDTFEGNTFKEALEDLKRLYNIGKVIVVADRGMLSKGNIKKTIQSGYNYIIGERLKTLPKAVKEQLLDRQQYKREWHYLDNQDKEVCVQYMTLHYEGKTIISTYSAKRAEKDKKDRLERIEKAAKLLKNKSSLKGKAARYFIKNDNQDSYTIDEEKIINHERYDGLLAISTNAQLDEIQILDQYKQLYKIEHSFRTFKSHLELRPMFHWTDRRIEGHICLCYIAFTLQNFVLQKINKYNNKWTERTLRKSLSLMQLSLIQNNDQQIYIRSKAQENENHLLNAMSLKPLASMMAKENFSL